MLIPVLLSLPTATAAPFYTAEIDADPAVVLVAWQSAMDARGLSTRPSLGTLLAEDHPALPLDTSLQFSGRTALGFKEIVVNGDLRVQRLEGGRTALEIEYVVGPTPRDEAGWPRLTDALAKDAGAHLGGAAPTPPQQDPLLADPKRCGPRVQAFDTSPFPGGESVLVGALAYAPPPCHRPLVAALVDTEAGKAAVTDWLLAGYAAAPDAQKSDWLPLVFQVPEPDARLEELIAQEEARLAGAPP
ncbi:MAG: hypothetical protein H6739_22105 [Alphaproteobacteria bacterium]|nr:hypothetical protein [Alphaproteobacteria bacterium]